MHFSSLRNRWPSALLCALFVALLLGAVTLDRSSWPLVGDEATYRMQAESLAFDLDLTYSRADHDRFLAHHGAPPEGLILQSGDRGATIAFGKPFFYAIYLAPFVRLAPVRGPFVANVFLLAAAAFLTARVLARNLGSPLGPVWAMLFVFASVAFAQVFWVHADLFLMCLTAIALALAFGPLSPKTDGASTPQPPLPGGEGESGGRSLRWIAVGGLLAIVVFSRPLYVPILLPVLVAAWCGTDGALRGAAPGRWRRAVALGLGAAGLVLGAAAVHQALAGSWTSYGAARRGFYGYTGFPDVDFPASEWTGNLADWGNHAWARPEEALRHKKMVASLLGWNTLYLAIGENVGLLPYFLPLLLGLLGRPHGLARWALLGAIALTAFGFLWLRPFNFYGGGGAVANRYLLPLYPAFWFLATRPLRGRWLLAVAAAAGLFLAPTWLAPRAYPLFDAELGETRYVSSAARHLLPYETTQSHLKPAGREDVLHGGLWIKFLDRGLRPVAEGSALKLRPGEAVDLLVGSLQPIATLQIKTEALPGAVLEVDGMRVEIHRGAEASRHPLEHPRARHPMWWTWDPFYLYRLRIRLEQDGPKPATLRLSAI